MVLSHTIELLIYATAIRTENTYWLLRTSGPYQTLFRGGVRCDNPCLPLRQKHAFISAHISDLYVMFSYLAICCTKLWLLTNVDAVYR